MNWGATKSRIVAAAAILAVGAALSACGPKVMSGGNRPLATDLDKIKPGEETKAEVQRILGSPSSKSLYGEEVWYYISETQESYAFFKPEETQRDIVAISFDKSGTVAEVKHLDLDDDQQVEISEKKTPTSGHNMSVVEQMVGNIGRFNDTTDRKGGSQQ